MYIRPKNGELGLLSAQPDWRSFSALVSTQKWVQLFGSSGVADLYPPSVQPFPSDHTVNQVPDGLLYRITGPPNGLEKGLCTPAAVKRVNLLAPSVEADAPEPL